MDTSFPEVKKYFGFGCMRLPMNGDAVDLPQFQEMVDRFLESGFNYFDTAHGYLNGLSELALAEGLTSRYPRAVFQYAGGHPSVFRTAAEVVRRRLF